MFLHYSALHLPIFIFIYHPSILYINALNGMKGIGLFITGIISEKQICRVWDKEREVYWMHLRVSTGLLQIKLMPIY